MKALSLPPQHVLRYGVISALLVGAALTIAAPASAQAPVVGGSRVGIQVTEVDAVATGWSAKNSLLGKRVHNEANESVGSIGDLIVAPDGSLSYAIVEVGGFLGIGQREVAIPVKQFNMADDKIVLPGATKDALKDLPQFKYKK